MLQANTPAMRSAVIRPMYGVMPAALQVLPPDASGASPLISGEPGRQEPSLCFCYSHVHTLLPVAILSSTHLSHA